MESIYGMSLCNYHPGHCLDDSMRQTGGTQVGARRQRLSLEGVATAWS